MSSLEPHDLAHVGDDLGEHVDNVVVRHVEAEGVEADLVRGEQRRRRTEDRRCVVDDPDALHDGRDFFQRLAQAEVVEMAQRAFEQRDGAARQGAGRLADKGDRVAAARKRNGRDQAGCAGAGDEDVEMRLRSRCCRHD